MKVEQIKEKVVKKAEETRAERTREITCARVCLGGHRHRALPRYLFPSDIDRRESSLCITSFEPLQLDLHPFLSIAQ